MNITIKHTKNHGKNLDLEINLQETKNTFMSYIQSTELFKKSFQKIQSCICEYQLHLQITFIMKSGAEETQQMHVVI